MLIYKATFPNDKSYIGLTLKTLEQRKKSHKNSSMYNKGQYDYNVIFHKAIRKYGWENVKWEILEDNITDYEYLKERERFNILKYDTFKSNGYNMTLGGEGCFGYKHTAKTRKRIKEKRAEQIITEETRIKMMNARIGYKHSEKTKEKISKSNKGNIGSMGLKNPRTMIFTLISPVNKKIILIGVSELKKFVKKEKLSLIMLNRYRNRGKILLNLYENRYRESKNTNGWEIKI